MRLLFLSFAIFSNCLYLSAQGTDSIYTRTIAAHRAHYKQSFLTDKRSPLTAKDTSSLDFYPTEASWKVEAQFTRTADAKPFEMPTYSGLSKRFVSYGVVSFFKDSILHTITLYSNLALSSNIAYKDHLFLPFKDITNGIATYGGGRYIDLNTYDIKEGKVIIDFNKCYNPWCAYSDGYNCPVPPATNHLKIAVEAGEKMFLGEKKH